MKKSILAVALIIISLGVYAQKQNDSTKKSPTFSLAGGLWAGFNETTTFVGFVGPKISVSFRLNSKTKLEWGINGIPGAVFDNKDLKNTKFGLAIGSTLTLKRTDWKMRPIIGAALLRTDKWQTVFGVGFLF